MPTLLFLIFSNQLICSYHLGNSITLNNCFEIFFLFCSLEYYPASPMDKLLFAVYLISSEWDMLQCVQFPTVDGFGMQYQQ